MDCLDYTCETCGHWDYVNGCWVDGPVSDSFDFGCPRHTEYIDDLANDNYDEDPFYIPDEEFNSMMQQKDSE